MKKVLISLLTISVLLNSGVVAFADTTTPTTEEPVIITETNDPSDSLNDTNTTTSTTPSAVTIITPEQKRALFYQKIHKPGMISIGKIRTQTTNVIALNNSISRKIQTALKSLNTNNTTKIKAAQKTVNLDEIQLKSLTQEAKSLQSQILRTAKSKNKINISNIQKQYQTLLTQIDTLTKKIATDKATVNSLQKELLNSKKQQVQPLVKQANSLAVKIKQEEIAKNKLWTTYNAQIKANDFVGAEKTLQSIIANKNQILQDIKSREAMLNQLLTMANTLVNK